VGRVDRLRLGEVEARRVRVDVVDVERRDHLLDREYVPVRPDAPAEQREVVEQPLGHEAAVAVEEHVGLGVTLGQLPVALPHHVRQVPVHRLHVRDADRQQRPEEDHLPRRGGEQVLPAQDVGDAHEGVVHRVGQRVQRLAVRPDDHEVGDRARREGEVTADEVGERHVLVRHPDAQHRLAPLRPVGRLLLLGEVTVAAVVAEFRVVAGSAVTLLEFLRRDERFVGEPGLEEPPGDVGVDVQALGLPVRSVRTADLHTLVPVQPEPPQGIEELAVGLLAVARGVGVLDPEDERAADVPGVRPVEQRRADQADVRRPRGRRAEPHPDGRALRLRGALLREQARVVRVGVSVAGRVVVAGLGARFRTGRRRGGGKGGGLRHPASVVSARRPPDWRAPRCPRPRRRPGPPRGSARRRPECR